ncbi:hypothetical protein C8Q74DRAFT_1293775 [Fomes fomentarius]|nr:hypothetical protein C8Q74DRAFT_1293775 [Fomes fomentarius]
MRSACRKRQTSEPDLRWRQATAACFRRPGPGSVGAWSARYTGWRAVCTAAAPRTRSDVRTRSGFVSVECDVRRERAGEDRGHRKNGNSKKRRSRDGSSPLFDFCNVHASARGDQWPEPYVDGRMRWPQSAMISPTRPKPKPESRKRSTEHEFVYGAQRKKYQRGSDEDVYIPDTTRAAQAAALRKLERETPPARRQIRRSGPGL